MLAGMATAPTTELGRITGLNTIPGWADFLVDEREHSPELRWPNSIPVYDRMRVDGQIAGLLAGLTLPIRRYEWLIDPNGAQPDLVEMLADDLGLPVKGQEDAARTRRRDRFSFPAHLFEALKALIYGHAYFEQVGRIENGKWRLRKLGPRPQPTIDRMNVAKDGGLVSIEQGLGFDRPVIPVGRLVAYVWEPDPGMWFGRSIIRPLYRDWLIKDRLIRVNAVGMERNASGHPHVEPPPGATDAQLDALQEMANAISTGTSTASVGVAGAKLRLLGVEGASPDIVATIRYHDEQMARSLLMMFMQLGQTETGSRALGETMVDYVALAQEAIAVWFADIVNQHVIEDWVDWNYGETAAAPLLTFRAAEKPEMAVEDLKALIDAGAVTVDGDLEAWLRNKGGLPERNPDSGPAPLPVAARAASRERGRPRAAGESTPSRLPDRPLRREPTDVELRAGVDFRAAEKVVEDAGQRLVAEWQAIRERHITELAEQIAESPPGNLEALAGIQATPAGADEIGAILIDVATQGAMNAQAEAAFQGVTLPDPDLTALREATMSRASAICELLARSLSEAAARRAVRLSSGLPTAEDIEAMGLHGPMLAEDIQAHLLGLTDMYLQTQFTATAHQSYGEGRGSIMEEAEGLGAEPTYYASELLDESTCDECANWDGHVFESLADAEDQYPNGQNKDCLGGERCRGMIVADYLGQTQEPSPFEPIEEPPEGPGGGGTAESWVSMDDPAENAQYTLGEAERQEVADALADMREAMPGLRPDDLTGYGYEGQIAVTSAPPGTNPGSGGAFNVNAYTDLVQKVPNAKPEIVEKTVSFIELNPDSIMGVKPSAVHELSHALDWNVGQRLGHPGFLSMTNDPAMVKFLNVARKSTSMYPIRQAALDGDKAGRYLYDGAEVFARAMTQYVSEKSGDKSLYDAFAALKGPLLTRQKASPGSPGGYKLINEKPSWVWDDLDWPKVKEALEGIIKKAEWDVEQLSLLD